MRIRGKLQRRNHSSFARSTPSKVLEREHDIESNFLNSVCMLYQTVRGLKNHKIVFTHADLQPGNIIRTDGTPVLLDWGLAGF